jgi:hypothetical protein
VDIPIVTKRPTVVFQPLDEDGDPSGSPVDVSCDFESIELTVDTPVTTLTTFCGTVQIPDEPEIGCDCTVAVNDATSGRWSGLVGDSVEVQIKDRTTDTSYRAFVSQVPIDPSLYGTTEPGEPRTVDFALPVLSEVTLVTPS